MIEPRKSYLVGVFVVAITWTMSRRYKRVWRKEPTGIREQGKGQKSSQGTWENRMRPRDQKPEQRVTPVKQHPGDRVAISPSRTSEIWKSTEVLRCNVTNGVTQDEHGSLSCLIVPMESRRTQPDGAWE